MSGSFPITHPLGSRNPAIPLPNPPLLPLYPSTSSSSITLFFLKSFKSKPKIYLFSSAYWFTIFFLVSIKPMTSMLVFLWCVCVHMWVCCCMQFVSVWLCVFLKWMCLSAFVSTRAVMRWGTINYLSLLYVFFKHLFLPNSSKEIRKIITVYKGVFDWSMKVHCFWNSNCNYHCLWWFPVLLAMSVIFDVNTKSRICC